jgi:predicted HNH restriction endonuclease
MALKPTRRTIQARIREFERIGQPAFIKKYSSGFGARAHYLLLNEQTYDLKAIWASAHTPSIWAAGFNTVDAVKGATEIGFTCVTRAVARAFLEGNRRRSETVYFARHKGLVEEAKRTYGFVCMGCHFDFEKFYGPIGKGCIECHHLHPMRANEVRNSTVADVAIVCSNCHTMIHQRDPHLAIHELRDLVTSFGKRSEATKSVSTNFP